MKPSSRLTPNIVDNATKTQSPDLRTRPHVTNADVIKQNNVIQFSILHQYYEFILSKSATTSNNKFLCTTTTLKDASEVCWDNSLFSPRRLVLCLFGLWSIFLQYKDKDCPSSKKNVWMFTSWDALCMSISGETLLQIYWRLIGRSYIAIARQEKIYCNISDAQDKTMNILIYILTPIHHSAFQKKERIVG